MPVNMDPKKKKRPAGQGPESERSQTDQEEEFGKETDQDREKDLADAESKNLWDQTEVIDMDTW